MATNYLKYGNKLLKRTYSDELESLPLEGEALENVIDIACEIEEVDLDNYSRKISDYNNAITKLQSKIDEINSKIIALQDANLLLASAEEISSNKYSIYNAKKKTINF